MSDLSHAVRRRTSHVLAAAATLAAAVAGIVLVDAPGSSAATCSDVDVVFARGTSEAQGLGSVGGPFVNAVKGALPNRTVSTYAVVYDANTSQSSAGPGSTDLVNHLTSVASSCSGTVFVLGGYSQGATVVDKALGIRTQTGGTGTAIPANLSGRVASAVAFGNPLGAQGQTIASASPTYGARSRDYCNSGDPVCGGGNNFAAHTQYVSNGSAADGGRFAAAKVPTGTTTPSPTPTTSPTTAPTTPAPTTSPTAAPAACVRASTRDHIAAGRATEAFKRAYAVGTRDSLGSVSSFNIVSLRKVSNGWGEVRAC